MDYQNVVRDFVQRTEKNLEAIERLRTTQPESEVYEVTQLVNSMLGLLVFPQQRYFKSIPEIPLSDLAARGWPVPVTSGSYPEVRTLRDLVRCMRNGIAHFNIEFLVGDLSQITGVRLWNMRRREKTWEAKLELEDLREIARRFVELIIDDVGPQQQRLL